MNTNDSNMLLIADGEKFVPVQMNGDILISNTYGKVFSSLGLNTPNDVELNISGDSSLLSVIRSRSILLK